jgi:hypothetical protein
MRIYSGTSVVGGCFDKEFADDSLRLFELGRSGRLTILISQVVLDELTEAPQRVRDVLTSMPAESLQYVTLSDEIIQLRNAYLRAGILGPEWMDDATHVAAATVAGADAIVSWNFRHIVRLDRIGSYNAVNVEQGYRPLIIVTPLEVTREIDSED